MTAAMLPVPLTRLDAAVPTVQAQGYAVLSASDVATCVGVPLADLLALQTEWADLPPDTWLKDGGRYRRRRHSCFVLDEASLHQAPHRAHWQPVEYNALHGGMQRWFEPMTEAMTAAPAWPQLLMRTGQLCNAVAGPGAWYIEAHQFRIDTTDGIGRPTPEGAHRDGVDFVAVFLINRQGIKGGETRVFDAQGPNGQRFTLTEPWSLLLLDDARVIHESTPIQPVDGEGFRDTLVLTFRRRAFQGESEA